jgi:hypothetical protein
LSGQLNSPTSPGGYDVMVEPFTDRNIQGAVLRVAASFEERRQSEIGDE